MSSSYRFGDIGRTVGQKTLDFVSTLGFASAMVFEALIWALAGWALRQPVRYGPVLDEMLDVGVRAVPIVLMLSGAIGIILTLQGIYTLRVFGAEEMIVFGIGVSVMREFAPLITAIVIAARSGSAFAARVATMTVNQEIDALQVIGIAPVRFIVVPILIAMLIMVPTLTVLSNAAALLAAASYAWFDMGMPIGVFLTRTLEVVAPEDYLHGLFKALVFGLAITIIGVTSGAKVEGGAMGVGRATTSAVVASIAVIVFGDMLFTFGFAVLGI